MGRLHCQARVKACEPGQRKLGGSIPVFSTYIRNASLHEVVCDTVGGLESCRQQRVSASQACETEPDFARCTLLPVAVAAAYVAARSGKPSAFFVDMMLACLSSCVHLLAGVQPYPSTDPSFVVRARFWAMITGEPNAGKSPTHSWLLGLLTRFMKANKDFFPWLKSKGVSHVYTRGTHAGFNEIMRDTQGACFCTNPEARTVLDPAFVSKLVADTKNYMNLSLLLESGGAYEWITAADLRKARAAREAAAAAEQAEGEPREEDMRIANDFLKFDHTSVNVCYFQQICVLRNWWVPLELNHNMGFCARILFSFAQRAVIDPTFGRGSVFAVGELFKAWLKQVCVNAGHHLAQAPIARFSLAQEAAMETLYGELASRWQGEDWGSAGQAALGKFEYHVGMMSQLLHCMSCQPGDIEAMSDCAFKCACRFFDQRLIFGCAVVDYTCERSDSDIAAKKRPAAASHPLADSVGRVLRHCTAEPITMTEMSRRLAHLRKDQDFAMRTLLLEQAAELDLGTVRQTARGVSFVRHPLTNERRSLLRQLGVPETAFCPADPDMNGAGRVEPSSVPCANGGHMNGAGRVEPSSVPCANGGHPTLIRSMLSQNARDPTQDHPKGAVPWVFSGVPFVQLQFDARTKSFVASGFLPLQSPPGTHVQWHCDTRGVSIPNLQLAPGAYAVVRCDGEAFLRAILTEPAAIGEAGGHAGLAAERPVLFAQKVHVGVGMVLRAWTNVSGTYHTPEHLATQSELPLGLFWAFRLEAQEPHVCRQLPRGGFLVCFNEPEPVASPTSVASEPPAGARQCEPELRLPGNENEARVEALSAVSFVGSSGGRDVDTDAELRDANGSPQHLAKKPPTQRAMPVQTLGTTARAPAPTACKEQRGTQAAKRARTGAADLPAAKKRHKQAEEQMEALVAEGEEEWSLSTQWQKLEAWLRASSCSFVAAWPVDKHVQKSPRFKCLCAGYETRAYRAPVCPVMWTAQVKTTQRDACPIAPRQLVAITWGSHVPKKPEAEILMPKKRYTKRADVIAQCAAVMLQTEVSAPMTHADLRRKAREHTQSKEAAQSAGRLPFDVAHQAGWKVVTIGQIDHVPLQCSSCDMQAECPWLGFASYDHEAKLFALKSNGRAHAPVQRKKGGTVTPAQRAELKSSISICASGRLMSVNALPESPPTQQQESDRRKNERRRQASSIRAVARPRLAQQKTLKTQQLQPAPRGWQTRPCQPQSTVPWRRRMRVWMA